MAGLGWSDSRDCCEHLIIKEPLWAGVALGLCNGAEALITAGLIHITTSVPILT
jgi:phosphoribosylformylglycinamidine (FGAM) synthase-like amidotransferase family enzyme